MPAPTKDAVLGSAVDLAREVAIELAEDASDVGEYLGLVVEGERLISHRFASTARGYRGWEWTVTVARVPRGRTATVCEAELLPGPDAVLGQAWLPWSERIRPGDIGPGDVLPFRADDPRLEPGWTPSGDQELDSVAIDELALARVRVLSPQGRDEAAERWYRGAHGPTSAGAVSSAAACHGCGFLVPLQGSLGTVFGVCANEWSPDDGMVVSLDHGCGAHSETDAEAVPTEWPSPDPVIDELKLELVPPVSRAAQASTPELADEPVVPEPVAALASGHTIVDVVETAVPEPAEAVATGDVDVDVDEPEPAVAASDAHVDVDETAVPEPEAAVEAADADVVETVASDVTGDDAGDASAQAEDQPDGGADEIDGATSPES
ncbi:DUF3027 domain-containing protein [Cellulomonas sp. McL0617]|uniref:DUF3027 domain-containing protein n=1 Tax=Cellulomonas sp. McL0617 TaxID=3415675 RepID=UPI003CEF0CFB